MEIREINQKYKFVNDWGYNRSGFYHKSTLLRNNVEIAYSKIQYYNRTWETYPYQTSMTRAVDSIIENELQFFIEECKRKYNIKRLTKEKREQAENQFYKVPHIVELLNIKEELKHRA